MKVLITSLLIMVSSFSYSQVTCSEFNDSLLLTSDTIYIDQATDTSADIGIQWMGFRDLSYMACEVDYNDSSIISIKGGTVTGGLFSPYPNPVFFSVDIDYLQQSIPINTAIEVSIDFFQGNMADTCNRSVTFIINPDPVSVLEISLPKIDAKLFPNPLISNSIIELSDKINYSYDLIIYNNQGKLVHRVEELNTQTSSLNRGIFKDPGVYFIQLEAKDRKSKAFKLIVQ